MDEIPDIKVGSFIRWIPLSNPDKIILTRGGNICDINITDKGTSIVVKNYFGKGMQVSMDKCLYARVPVSQSVGMSSSSVFRLWHSRKVHVAFTVRCVACILFREISIPCVSFWFCNNATCYALFALYFSFICFICCVNSKCCFCSTEWGATSSLPFRCLFA